MTVGVVVIETRLICVYVNPWPFATSGKVLPAVSMHVSLISPWPLSFTTEIHHPQVPSSSFFPLTNPLRLELQLQSGKDSTMMVINTKLSFAFLLFSFFFFLSVTFSLVVAADEDPELQQCKRLCWAQHQFSHRQRKECEQKCEDYYRQKQHGGDGEREGEGGGEGEGGEPEKQLRQCQKQCELQQEQQKEQCRRQCQETCGRQREEGEGQGGGGEKKDNQQHQQEEEVEEEQQEQNPYVFQDEHFITSQSEGRVKILQKFHQRSRLLRGLENYRFLSIEANPQTFVLPAHLDAEAVLYVASGIPRYFLLRYSYFPVKFIAKSEFILII